MRRDAATEALVAPYVHGQDGADDAGRPSHGGPWLLTFVDLTLQLLAFFVLLNALSNFDASRVGPVLESVDSHFKRNGDVVIATPVDIARQPVTAKDGDYIMPSQFKDHIAGIIAREFAVEAVLEQVASNVFAVDVPVRGLFDANGKVHPARAGFVGRIADALIRRPQGIRYEMEVILGSARAPGRGDDTLLLAQAGAAAEQFLLVGTPADALSVAIARRDPNMLRLEFTVRDTAIGGELDLLPAGDGAGAGGEGGNGR
jgi:hypothetical protein